MMVAKITFLFCSSRAEIQPSTNSSPVAEYLEEGAGVIATILRCEKETYLGFAKPYSIQVVILLVGKCFRTSYYYVVNNDDRYSAFMTLGSEGSLSSQEVAMVG